MRTIESSFVPYLLNSVWQIPLLFAVGWLAARMLRRLGPAAEHRLWVAVLLLQCLLPACSAVLPEWLPSLVFRTAHSSIEGDVSATMGPAFVSGGIHFSGGALAVITIAYCAVTLWFAARFFWRLLHLRALREESVEAVLSDETRELWTACLRRFDCSGVSLAVSPRIFSPLTMGLVRPLVLLPAGSLAVMSPVEFQAVAAHELAHIRRGDFLRNLLYEMVALPASYHPLLWFTREQMAQTREMICDRMAAQSSGRRQYTRALLRLASLLVRGQPLRTPYTLGIFDTKTLERRVMSLTEETGRVGALRRVTLAATCAALLAGTCGTALALRMHVDGLAQASDGPSTRPTGPGPIKPEVMAKRRISAVMPTYPEAAKKAGIEGTVVLDAVIGKDGSVEHLAVVSGPKELQSSSLEAVRQWKYKPYLLNGEPIEVQTTIKVVYALAKKNAHGK